MVTPYQVLPVSWQLAQLLVIPAWFMAVPGPNAVNAVGEWQLSQANPLIGKCVAGGSLGVMLAKVSPAAWHCAQLVVMPEWLIVYTA